MLLPTPNVPVQRYLHYDDATYPCQCSHALSCPPTGYSVNRSPSCTKSNPRHHDLRKMLSKSSSPHKIPETPDKRQETFSNIPSFPNIRTRLSQSDPLHLLSLHSTSLVAPLVNGLLE